MRSRQEIKELAKQAFAAQRSTAVIALFLVGLFTAGYSIITSAPSIISNFMYMSYGYNYSLASMLATIGGILGLLAIPFSIIAVVLNVNLCGVFAKVYYGIPISGTEAYTEIKTNFGRKLGGTLWEALWLYLWALVGMFTLFIPTVIKALSYSMTPYILANNPNVTATEALKLSKRMTKGHKGQIFILFLSFIGWQILNLFTFGILGIFYVNPYMYTTIAGFFIELRNLAVANGVISVAEFDGFQTQHPYTNQYPQYPPAPPPPQSFSPHPGMPPPPPQTYSQHPGMPPPPPPQPYAPHPVCRRLHRRNRILSIRVCHPHRSHQHHHK